MPELPEVEILVRHLRPLLQGRTITSAVVNRPKVVKPHSESAFTKAVSGRTFEGLTRRAKYLVFKLAEMDNHPQLCFLGHLGMTGRMYLQAQKSPLPKHAAVVFGLGRDRFVFEDARYFGRLTLDISPLDRLGPEPLERRFTAKKLAACLASTKLAIKPVLMDQARIAGIGNLYASEILHRARISPFRPANRLTRPQIISLLESIRFTLREAIRFGSTVPLAFGPDGNQDGLFYYGQDPSRSGKYEEGLRVYDRKGLPCPHCEVTIQRAEQAGRSTYYCPNCQR